MLKRFEEFDFINEGLRYNTKILSFDIDEMEIDNFLKFILKIKNHTIGINYNGEIINININSDEMKNELEELYKDLRLWKQNGANSIKIYKYGEKNEIIPLW